MASAAGPPGTRERLLEAGTALFSERGYAAAGVGPLCARAGVAKTALYHHFGSKEGLLAAVLEAAGGRWIEQLRKRAYLGGTPEQRIEELIAGWRGIVLEEPQVLRLPMIAQLEQGEASPRVREALLRVWHRAERALVEGIEDSLGRSLPDLDLVAHTVITLLQGAMLRQIVEPDEARLDRALSELRRTLALVLAARLAEPSDPPEAAEGAPRP